MLIHENLVILYGPVFPFHWGEGEPAQLLEERAQGCGSIPLRAEDRVPNIDGCAELADRRFSVSFNNLVN